MVYNYQSVPLNKKVYCIGFRCGDSAKPSVNCKPTFGIVKMCKYYGGYREFISDKDNTFVISFHEQMQNRSYYYFADTYEEAVKKYNELVNVVYKKYYDLTCKIGQNFIGGVPR
jgi:hypothetical protein